jgi:hypothetical protein
MNAEAPTHPVVNQAYVRKVNTWGVSVLASAAHRMALVLQKTAKGTVMGSARNLV